MLISDVEEAVLFCNENFRIAKNIFDPWQMKSTAERLRRLIPVEEFTFTSSSIQKLSQNLYYLFHNGLIKIFPHPLLEEELLSLNAEEKSYGWRIDHKSGGFSDHVVSLGMSSMYAVQEERGQSGFVITGAPTISVFLEQCRQEEISGEQVSKEGAAHIINQASFPTLRELEAWRQTQHL